MFLYIGQGGDASRAYYQSQGQRSDQRLASEKQGNDLRSQSREEDMEIGYEDNVGGQTFEGLEQRFYDDILKLTKEQNDAEDAENARHREVCEYLFNFSLFNFSLVSSFVASHKHTLIHIYIQLPDIFV